MKNYIEKHIKLSEVIARLEDLNERGYEAYLSATHLGPVIYYYLRPTTQASEEEEEEREILASLETTKFFILWEDAEMAKKMVEKRLAGGFV